MPHRIRIAPSRYTLVGLAGAALLALAGNTSAQTLPAFPGAEGFGAAASGGRGGQVIKVTTLAASGAGSLQAAVNRAGPRIVVFAVSGVIAADLHIPHGDLTIAGQTAPGGGITIAGHVYTSYPTTFGNIVLRHLRVRPPASNAQWPPDQHDAIQMSANRLLMFDHLDISHSIDELVDFYEGARDITVQRSILSFPIQGGGHPDGANHNFGLLNGPGGGRISVLRNLFAHARARTPALSYGPAEVINNVIYNAREGFVHHNPAVGDFKLIGNYYRDGASANLLPIFLDPENDPGAGRYYMAGNYVDHPGSMSAAFDNPFLSPAFMNAYGDAFIDGERVGPEDFVSTPFDFTRPGYIAPQTSSAAAAYTQVLCSAGAWPRDQTATRAVNETQARTGTWSGTRPSDWFAGLTAGTAPTDSDGDGMPDTWEQSRGLNPNSAADVHQPQPDGYPAIESYLNERAAAVVGCASDGVFEDGFELP